MKEKCEHKLRTLFYKIYKNENNQKNSTRGSPYMMCIKCEKLFKKFIEEVNLK